MLRITDLNGQPRWQYAVEPDAKYGKISVAPGGSVMAYALIRNLRTVLRHGQSGDVLLVTEDKHAAPLFHFFLGERVAVVRPDQHLEIFDGTGWRRHASTATFDQVCADTVATADRVIVVDNCQGTIWWQSATTGQSFDRRLVSPALESARSEVKGFQAQRTATRSSGRLSAVGGVEASGNSLWAYLLPFNRAVGLIVEEFALDGEFRRSLRLGIPDGVRHVPVKVLVPQPGQILLVYPSGETLRYEIQ